MSAAAQEKSGVVWDLTSYFPTFDGPEMRAFKEQLKTSVEEALAKARTLDALNSTNQAEWEEMFLGWEDITSRLGHIFSFVSCLSSADSTNEAYQKEIGSLHAVHAEMQKLGVELSESLKRASDADFEAFKKREKLADAAHYLDRTREDAKTMMEPKLEGLAADLGIDGINAWSRLYETVISKLQFEMVWPDGRKEMRPMAQRRSIMEDVDGKVRKAAFDGGSDACATMEDTFAAALNHIAGTRLTLNKHRGVDHFLDVALFQSSITRKTLDAMMEAIHSTIELPRRIAKVKANALGQDALGWWDVSAQLRFPDQKPLSWDEGTKLCRDSFRGTMPAIADYLDHAMNSGWVESEPRNGKRPGAYCTSSRVTRESRVFMTYEGTVGDVRTLAHEIGHAFHNWVMRDMRPYSRSYPMTLAESASTFAEMILCEGVLNGDLSDQQKAAMLNMEVSQALSMLLDIPVRFEFEKAFYEERQKGELSVSRIKELMCETQRRIFGDALSEDGVDSYFWAWKGHFYIAGVTFYNYPYTFGYLLSRSLFAQFRKEGADFIPKYIDFLRLTGSDTAENVARRSIGQDLESPEFWKQGIVSLEEDLKQFQELLPRVMNLN